MAISGFPSSLEREKRARLRQRLLLIYPEKAKGRGSKSLRVLLSLFIAIWILSLSLSGLRSKRMAARVGSSSSLGNPWKRERKRWMWLDGGKKYSSRKKVSKREALVSDRERSSMQMKGAGEGALICRWGAIDGRRGGCECSLHFAREWEPLTRFLALLFSLPLSLSLLYLLATCRGTLWLTNSCFLRIPVTRFVNVL